MKSILQEYKFAEHQIIDCDVDIPFKNVGDLLETRAKENLDREFIIAPGKTTERFTYKEFFSNVKKTCSFLESKNLNKEHRVNIIIPNSADFLFIYFACLRLGITAVPINEDLAPKEMNYIIQDSESKVVIYNKKFDFKVEEIKKLQEENEQNKPEFICLNSYPDFEPITFEESESLPDVKPNDEAIIIYTSGTTGNPKGVVLVHLSLLADAYGISDCFKMDKDTRTLCILPMFHNNGQIVTLLSPLYVGGSNVVVKGKASLRSFWDLIHEYNVSWTSVMPSILSLLSSLPYKRKDNTMKGIICGGQVLTEQTQEIFENKFGIPVFEGYGLTESTAYACLNRYPKENRKLGSVGKPLKTNEMEIFRDDGTMCDPLEEGEICIKGINVAKEYLKLDERNKVSFRDGWFHSGDYGHKDKEGYIYFSTRKDYLIIKSGENIYPAEIENVLQENENVAEVAVIGIPHKINGQDVAAFVRLKEDGTATEKDLKEFCKGKIAGFKQPSRIFITNELDDLETIPKGPTKKVLYRELSAYYDKKYGDN